MRERDPTSFCSRSTLLTGWSSPVREATWSSTAEINPTSVPRALPASFTARYSLTVVDEANHEVFSNSSVRPTDRQISGAISLDLPGNRLGLNIVAYRGGGAWLPYVPAALILVLTMIATATLLQLRRYARRRAETEDQLRAAYAFRQAMSQSLVTGLRAIDLEGRITFVNAAFCRMTGFDEGELVGVAPPYPYWPPEALRWPPLFLAAD